ncbi:hypothetical protein GII36_02250 [Candidatus Mycosynbacter amalyticus]|uniref:Uncharacterized protein n=1 Tax=Candidatus Mycosynbacter amalyticus TaxID=2665156 RepID=A0A857MN18_9BACT|nr:hypothetical protein [Candidatus Mycosynbacter amalyticus]QHN42669.1 hypothetical protein GII36_02250 [Candidatus Mycosynbacter amalyticus]
MDSNTVLDDAQQDDEQAELKNFTQHGMTVSPVSSEEAVRRDAASVIPRIPLPGETLETVGETHSYSPDHSTQNLDELSAEDIREDY